jgi:hypothetical protein
MSVVLKCTARTAKGEAEEAKGRGELRLAGRMNLQQLFGRVQNWCAGSCR